MVGRVRLLFVLLPLALASGCGAAYTGGDRSERPAVVVLKIKGKSGDRIRGDIIELLRKSDYGLIARKRYVQTARKLDATKLRAKHIARVSAELGAGAVIRGRIKRRGKRRYLYVSIHDGSSGKRVKRFRVRLTRARKLTRKGTRRLETRLMTTLAAIGQPADRDEVVAKDDAEDPPKDEGELTPREKRERKEAEVRAERERKEAEAREREEAEARARAKAKAEREAKERREREAAEREAAAIKAVANPETDDSGQAIDEEAPPGL